MEQRTGKITPLDAATRRRMRSVGQADTAAEVAIRRILWARGLRYRKDRKPLAMLRTKADLVLVGPRVAVYIDGCFWHGCPEHATWPKNNESFWRKKIETNMARDRRIDEELQAAGWLVVRVWEHEDPEGAARRVEEIVRARMRTR